MQNEPRYTISQKMRNSTSWNPAKRLPRPKKLFGFTQQKPSTDGVVVKTPVPVPPMSSPQPNRLPTPDELFGVIPQRPVSTPASVMNRPMMPLPVRRPGGKKYERDLREILDLLDEPVEDLTKNFANMNMGPKRMKTGNIPWGLGTEPRRYLGLEKRPWGV